MTPPTDVSIIIPVYNRTALLGPTLQGVYDQTHTSWELIIVDDGSSEDVPAALIPYQSERLHYVRQENQGNAMARNNGIAQAQGDFVICLDSDDVWHPEMLARCLTRFEAAPEADVVYTQHRYIDEEGGWLNKRVQPEPHNGNLLEPLLLGLPILPSSALVRRRCYEQWGAFSPGLDDWELWLRWAAHGCRFRCVEQPLLHYRVHDRNFNLDWPKRHAAHFKMLDVFYQTEDLPPAALELRDLAYATQHFRFAVLGWHLGRSKDGLTQFVKAALAHPAYLTDLDFYTRLACAHQERAATGTAEGLDLAVAARTLEDSLEALYKENNLPAAIHRQRSLAYAWAYLALARLAYAAPMDMPAARRFLLAAVTTHPAIVWQSDWAAWMARALVGRRTLQRVKGWVSNL